MTDTRHQPDVVDVTPKPQPARSTNVVREQLVHHAMVGDLPNPRQARRWLYTMALSVVVLLGWASVAKIDQVTRTQATLIAEARTQLVQSPEGGVVTRVHIVEGQPVKAGQLLVTLEKERAQAGVADSRAKVAALRITLARLQAEVYERPLQFDADLLAYGDYIRNQTALFTKRSTAIQQDIAALQSILELARTELQINSKLLPTGDVSRAEILRLQRSEADIAAQLTNKRNKYFQDSQAEMTKVQEDLSTQTEQLRDRSQLLEHTELMAPADGVVNNIRATTPGAVVRPGDVVLEILPTGTKLIAEARVSPSDIAFVTVGQSATVKLDAYDSSIYGSLRGEVTYISPDVLTEDNQQGRCHS